MYQITLRDVERIWSKVIPDGTGCFLWTGSKTKLGYGSVYLNRKSAQVHRAAYEIAKGPIPHGLTIDHLCRNPSCVNPFHLEAVSQRINTLRGIGPTAKRGNASSCPKGHPYAGQNVRIDYRGNRECMECRKEAIRRWEKMRPARKRDKRG